MKGFVAKFEYGATHDGQGLRTVVFLAGCKQLCPWCHNPEFQSFTPVLLFRSDLCVGCGSCARICKSGAQSFVSGVHTFDRTLCRACGECVEVCPIQALELSAHKMSSEEVVSLCKKDNIFYKNTGGGVTLSGGEVCDNLGFACDILHRLEQEGIDTAVETSASATEEQFSALIKKADTVLLDIKCLPEDYEKLIGFPFETVRKNLAVAQRENKPVVFRCPIIPGVSDSTEFIRFVSALAGSFSCVLHTELMFYHEMWRVKAHAIGKLNEFHPPVFSKQQKNDFFSLAEKILCKPVRLA